MGTVNRTSPLHPRLTHPELLQHLRPERQPIPGPFRRAHHPVLARQDRLDPEVDVPGHVERRLSRGLIGGLLDGLLRGPISRMYFSDSYQFIDK